MTSEEELAMTHSRERPGIALWLVVIFTAILPFVLLSGAEEYSGNRH